MPRTALHDALRPDDRSRSAWTWVLALASIAIVVVYAAVLKQRRVQLEIDLRERALQEFAQQVVGVDRTSESEMSAALWWIERKRGWWHGTSIDTEVRTSRLAMERALARLRSSYPPNHLNFTGASSRSGRVEIERK